MLGLETTLVLDGIGGFLTPACLVLKPWMKTQVALVRPLNLWSNFVSIRLIPSC